MKVANQFQWYDLGRRFNLWEYYEFSINRSKGAC